MLPIVIAANQHSEKRVQNYIAITGSASLSYPPFLGQRGGASNALLESVSDGIMTAYDTHLT